eukprot:418501-Pyramimonas_sp.AAC.1
MSHRNLANRNTQRPVGWCVARHRPKGPRRARTLASHNPRRSVGALPATSQGVLRRAFELIMCGGLGLAF